MLLQKSFKKLNLWSFFILVAFLLLGQLSSKNSVHGAIDPEAFRCRNITRHQIVDYLFRNCYLKRAEFEGITLLDEDLQNAIRFFQKVNRDSIEQISGVLDRETCRLIQSNFIDPLPIQHIRRRIRRYTFNSYKWSKTNLTYWFKPAWPAGDMRNKQTQQILTTALSLWSEVSRLRFRKNPYFWAADIRIKFASGDHGDGFPFHGAGNTLGHTFTPDQIKKRYSMVHLDLDKNWNFEKTRRRDRISLLHVMAHEIGHVLGLDHSNAPIGVMFRRSGRTDDAEQLCEDDVNAIQRLYEEWDPRFKFDWDF